MSKHSTLNVLTVYIHRFVSRLTKCHFQYAQAKKQLSSFSFPDFFVTFAKEPYKSLNIK